MNGRPLHICHVLLTDHFAGSERYAIEMANWQARVHRVSLILTRRAGELRPDALAHRVSPNVQIHWTHSWPLLRTLQARRLVEQLAPDVAHGHLSHACKALQGVAGTTTTRVATLHIRYKPQQHSKLDALIAIAPWQIAESVGRDAPPMVHIDNWATACHFDPEARARLRTHLNIAPDECLVGTLGRVERSKGHGALIEAWQQLRSPRARLAIVGHGRDWHSVRRQAPAEVIMPGFSEHPQDWLSAFDIFVSNALSEPFGLVFLEAMQCGLPIVASDSEGAQHLRHLIGPSLVPRGQTAPLVHALSQAIEERRPRQHYDLSAFDIARQAAHIEAFYRSSMQKSLHRPDA